jgi:hypothetical protein
LNADPSVRPRVPRAVAAIVAAVAATVATTTLTTAGIVGTPAAAQDVRPKPATLLPAPVTPVPPLLDRADVDHALAALDGIVERMMAETGVPGVAGRNHESLARC